MNALLFYFPGMGGGSSPPPPQILPPAPTPAPVAKKPDQEMQRARADEAKRAKLRQGTGGTNKTRGALVDDDVLTTNRTLLS